MSAVLRRPPVAVRPVPPPPGHDLRGLGSRGLASSDAGQAIVWVALMLPLLLSVVGVAADGGLVFDTRVELQNIVDGAARAGATQLDAGAYRQSGGATVALDVRRAEQAARDYLTAQRVPLTATIDARPDRVVVQASEDVPTAFVRIVGLERVRIAAAGTAEVRHGVERAQQ
jgi:Flp pilus assembly protein TadG